MVTRDSAVVVALGEQVSIVPQVGRCLLLLRPWWWYWWLTMLVVIQLISNVFGPFVDAKEDKDMRRGDVVKFIFRMVCLISFLRGSCFLCRKLRWWLKGRKWCQSIYFDLQVTKHPPSPPPRTCFLIYCHWRFYHQEEQGACIERCVFTCHQK